MASSSISFSQMNVQHTKPFQIERRPKLLKDFLDENSNSCSSSEFKSFPRQQPCNPKIVSKTRLFSNPSTKVARKFPKSHRTVSAFQALINAVKSIPFTTVKSPSFLPRSLSRRLSKRDHSRSNKSRKGKQDQEKENHEVKISVKVKDILRWTSFRDLVDERSPPLDFSPASSHDQCATTTTGSISSYSCNSDGSSFSWCESDITSDFLPSWSGNSNSGEKELEMGKKQFSFVGLDSVEVTTETANCTEVDPQDGEILLLYEEVEQQSPVSVFDFQFRETEEPYSAFDETLANVERTRQKLIQNIKRFESLANLEGRMSMEESADFDDEEEEGEDEEDNEKEEEYGLVEERARELLVYVKATSSTLSFCNNIAEEDQLLFDFFRDELRALKNEYSNHGEFNWEMMSVAKAWLNGEHKVFEWGIEYNKEAYIREMHKVSNWSKFEVEQEELALEIGDGMLEQLIDEVLADLFSKY